MRWTEGSRRRSAAFVVLVVVVLAVGTAGAVVVDSGGEGRTAATPTTVAPLEPAAAELLEALRTQLGATYHARYEGTSPDLGGGTIRLETWQSPPLRRQDSEVVVDGVPVGTSTIATPTGTVRCTRRPAEEWSCVRIDDAAAGDLVGVGQLDAYEERIRAGTVDVRDDEVAGRSVRCFTLTVAGETSEQCTTDAGVPVLVRAAGSEIRLLDLDTDIDDRVFEPPADPIDD